MHYVLLSLFAGMLTVFAPCVFSLLPVVLGGSLTGRNWRKPLVIILSLSGSIFLFTLLLKASSLLISIPAEFWNYLSGGILIAFGIVTLFPRVWEKIDAYLKLTVSSENLLNKAGKKDTILGDIAVGAALGPVFSSCSPTYAIIIATVLPQQPVVGILNLLMYLMGLAATLLVISVFGQKLIAKASWAVNPNGVFKRSIGVLFLVVGLLIFTGLEKQFETYLLDKGLFDVTGIEVSILNGNQKPSGNSTLTYTNPVGLNVAHPYKAPELTGIADWVNSAPLTVESLKGKVVLVDFWTYSCINCIRTLPYTTAWYNKYKDQGLVIIGVHSPEFSFEKIQSNVEMAAKKYNVTYPVALDNEMATWNAFQNQYWPATYFIDRNGNVVHTHFGEGNYEENEKIIQYLLGINQPTTVKDGASEFNEAQTPETYLGYSRFDSFLNADGEFQEDKTISYTTRHEQVDAWSLQGRWNVGPEYITSHSDTSKLILNFSAKEVYLVMGANKKSLVTLKVFDGNKLVGSQTVEVSNYDLYTVAKLAKFTVGQRLEITAPSGVQMNAFTFGS